MSGTAGFMGRIGLEPACPLAVYIAVLELGGSLAGVAVSLVSFAVLGTVAALWEKPLFIRMTPAGGILVTAVALVEKVAGRSRCRRTEFWRFRIVPGKGGGLSHRHLRVKPSL